MEAFIGNDNNSIGTNKSIHQYSAVITSGNTIETIADTSDNLKERGAIPYLEIHDMLTTDPDNSGVSNKLKAIISSVNDENDPYSWEDLESNLTSNSTIDDFKYFNNASNIYTGYAYKPNYMNL